VTSLADRHLRVARLLGRVDPEAAERTARALLEAIGADPAAEDLADTPAGSRPPVQGGPGGRVVRP
jgi:hypothetical protein